MRASRTSRRRCPTPATSPATSPVTAGWLGASLADLATATSRTREAARKRWPELGEVHRRRFWLGRQVEGIRWAAGLVVEARPALAAPRPHGVGGAGGG